MKTATKTLFAALGCLIFFCACTKYEKVGSINKPGIALTFDDGYVDEWYQFLPLFDSFQVKATFYVCGYKNLSPEQKKKLKTLQQHGHEIAFHSTSHPDFVKYLQRNKIAKLEEEEIRQGLQDMNNDGIYPQTFAYPYGSHNEILDNCLLRRFKSIRALNGTKNFSKSFAPTTDNSILYAIGMDLSSGKTTEQLLNFVSLAKQNNDCLVLVGHHINNHDTKMEVPYYRLKKIIKSAVEQGLEFYTASAISRK
ncbi:MAG TPA: polysaccharide deacetylase family protein [Flavisolibacter sp.]|jgi:peptidoglycan/xylan/chitin deacetylase (PgdA/CDA1 family)|nr:polysaccharide deacetylase family protein [Flavisolibacter sp.]